MGERIALGFCNNVDYEIAWRGAVLEELVAHYRIRAGELAANGPIESERDLVISILSFMSADMGGERFVSDSDLIERFAARFEKRITLGGTSVRAAIAMRKLGYTSALHLITQNDEVRRLIPSNCPFVCGNARDSFYPHLIVQFDAGDRVRAGEIDIRARRANRLIFHCNADRISMKLNPDFADLIRDSGALLVSGFNAMQSRALMAERLATLARILKVLPDDAIVYLEDGGYFNPSFRRLLELALGSRLTVLGLNEDELQARLSRKVDFGDVEQTRSALSELLRRIPAETVVLHTRHWALAFGADASRYAAALKAGVTMATTRFRYGDDFTMQDYRVIEGIPPSARNAAFARDVNSLPGGQMVCVPVAAVDQAKPTTIGLGDAFVGGFLPALLQ